MNVMKLMKQAQSMQKNMAKMQEELSARTFEFTAGGAAAGLTRPPGSRSM